MAERITDFTVTKLSISEEAFFGLSKDIRQKVEAYATDFRRNGQTVSFEISTYLLKEIGLDARQNGQALALSETQKTGTGG